MSINKESLSVEMAIDATMKANEELIVHLAKEIFDAAYSGRHQAIICGAQYKFLFDIFDVRDAKWCLNKNGFAVEEQWDNGKPILIIYW